MERLREKLDEYEETERSYPSWEQVDKANDRYMAEREAVERLTEALRLTTAALDDAIKAAVNADWSQEDYDEWNAARSAAEAVLAGRKDAPA